MVDKIFFSGIICDKPIALLIIEPFYFTLHRPKSLLGIIFPKELQLNETSNSNIVSKIKSARRVNRRGGDCPCSAIRKARRPAGKPKPSTLPISTAPRGSIRGQKTCKIRRNSQFLRVRSPGR
jgi:hypothetical protein